MFRGFSFSIAQGYLQGVRRITDATFYLFWLQYNPIDLIAIDSIVALIKHLETEFISTGWQIFHFKTSVLTNRESTDWMSILTGCPKACVHGVFIITIINNECMIPVIIFYWLIRYISTDDAFFRLSLNGLNDLRLFSWLPIFRH